MFGARLDPNVQGIARVLHLHVDRIVALQRKHQGMPGVAWVQIRIEQAMAYRRAAGACQYGDPRAVRVVDHEQGGFEAAGGLQPPFAIAQHVRTGHGREVIASGFRIAGMELPFGKQAGTLIGLLRGDDGQNPIDARDAALLRHHRLRQHHPQQNPPPPQSHAAPFLRAEVWGAGSRCHKGKQPYFVMIITVIIWNKSPMIAIRNHVSAVTEPAIS